MTRTYVYAGRPYDLKATGITVVSDALVAGRRFSRPQRADFTVRSRTTGEVTTFQITYASTGDAAEVPLRIVYQPRWWLQLELELRG